MLPTRFPNRWDSLVHPPTGQRRCGDLGALLITRRHKGKHAPGKFGGHQPGREAKQISSHSRIGGPFGSPDELSRKLRFRASILD